MVRLISTSCFAMLHLAVVAMQETPFLSEILLGRCYLKPPSGNVESSASCPSIVSSFMDVLDGHLDETITVENFSSYLDNADWTPTSAGALFWLGGSPNGGVGGASDENAVILKGWKTPEMTPGGALIDGLSFCGVNNRENCPDTISGAYSSFWIGAYAKYAANLPEDRNIHIVLEGGKSPNLMPFLLGVLPELNLNRTTAAIMIYSNNCHSKPVQTIISAIKASGGAFGRLSGKGELSCSADIAPLFVCQDPTSPGCSCLKQGATSLLVHKIGPNVTEPVFKGQGSRDKLHGELALLFLFTLLWIVIGSIFFTSWIKALDRRNLTSKPPPERCPLQPKHKKDRLQTVRGP